MVLSPSGNHVPLRVGITGGIGSGKSTVSAIFESLGVPVYSADDAAKKLMNESAELKIALIRNFGEQIYREGILDRKYLAGLVFGNPEKLELLNSIVHPETLKDAEQWMQQQKTPYALKEAALIFESGAQEFLDFVIGVSAPQPLRILRIQKRDQVSREEVLSRIKNQLDEKIKMKLCDKVILNDDQQALLPQVIAVHEELLAKANSLNRPAEVSP